MPSSATRYLLDPGCGRVLARTVPSRSGPSRVMSEVGRDLLLEVTRWHAELLVEADRRRGSVHAELAVNSLAVREGSAGPSLTDDDRGVILHRARRVLSADRHPTITFDAEELPVGDLMNSLSDGDPVCVEGLLTVAGRSAPLRLAAVREAADRFRLRGRVVQSAHGIRPYAGAAGLMRLRDAVDVELDLVLPSPRSRGPHELP